MNWHPEILLYTRLRKSPYFHASGRHGVEAYSVVNHQYHPRRYGDPIKEYWTLVNDVTLWDVGAERQVEITGPDAWEFSNMLTMRDLSDLKVDQGKYALITKADGGIISDPVLLRVDDQRFWFSTAESTLLVWAYACAHWSGMDVHVQEADISPVQVQGQKALDVMVDLFDDSIKDMRRYWSKRYELDGMDVVVSRTGFTNVAGYEIYLENAKRDADKLWETVYEAGHHTVCALPDRCILAGSKAASCPTMQTWIWIPTHSKCYSTIHGSMKSIKKRHSLVKQRSKKSATKASIGNSWAWKSVGHRWGLISTDPCLKYSLSTVTVRKSDMSALPAIRHD